MRGGNVVRLGECWIQGAENLGFRGGNSGVCAWDLRTESEGEDLLVGQKLDTPGGYLRIYTGAEKQER